MLQKLLDADPRNAIYRRRQAVVESQWADALSGAAQVSAAVAHNEKALSFAQALSQDAPGSVQYRSDVGISERKLSRSTLLISGNAAEALHHAEQAGQILCPNEAAPADSFTLANCGQSLLAAGNAQLAIHNPTAALATYRKAEKIAFGRSQAEPLNAVLRSDWAHSQAALAGGLAETGDYQASRGMP